MGPAVRPNKNKLVGSEVVWRSSSLWVLLQQKIAKVNVNVNANANTNAEADAADEEDRTYRTYRK